MIKHGLWHVPPGVDMFVMLLLGAIGFLAAVDGCAAAKPACLVINVADVACGAFVSVKLENGDVVQVPVGDIRNAAKRTQQIQKENER